MDIELECIIVGGGAVGLSAALVLGRPTGVLVAASLRQCSGVAALPAGPIAENAVEIDMLHRTSAPGLFAAGDMCAQMPQVAAAIAPGSLSAAAIVQSLLTDDFGLPVPPWPNQKENDHAHA